MSPVLANNYMGRRVNYTDRRKIRFDRRQESNGAQMLFQHLAKKIETMKILSIKRKRSTTEREGTENGEGAGYDIANGAVSTHRAWTNN